MPLDIRSGAVLAGFRVVSLIGEGATGSVYLAEETPTGRRVALKLLAPELGRDERFRRRFLRETEIAASIEHPHVVPTLASGEEDGLLYLAMDYVDGSDLRKLLRDDGRLEPRRAVELLTQVARALDAAHQVGLVHRDVKPGNILVARDAADGEHAYVCDFGLARHVSSVSSLTGERGFVGTIDYVPPEQIEGGAIDARADVYSLGCVLFECVIGERPFDRESELSVVFAHLNEPPPRVADLRPELPGAFDEVIATALAKAPDDRYGSCGELAAAARAALAGRPLPRRRRRIRRVFVAAAVLAAAAGITAGVLSLRGGRHAAPPPLPIRPNALSVLDPSGLHVVDRVALAKPSVFGTEPSDLVFAGGSAWALLPGQHRLVRVDPRTRKVVASVRLPWFPGPRLATGAGLVWAAEAGGPHVAGMDPVRADIVRRFDVPGAGAGGIAYGGGSLWISQGDNVARIDPRTGQVLRRVRNPGQSGATTWLAYADGALWSARGMGIVRKIDPVAGRISWTAHVDGWLSDLTVGDGYVWAPKVPDGIVYRFSEDDLTVLTPLRAGRDPERVALVGHTLWVANGTARTISRVDVGSGSRRAVALSAEPTVVRYQRGRLWTAAKPSPQPLPPIAGSEVRYLGGVNADPIYQSSTVDEQSLYARCANLLGYPDEPGLAGTRLRPEIAAAMPTVSLNGRRYTFRVRSGFRFSPPSNQPITAQTFRATAERALSPKVDSGSPGAQKFSDLFGAAAYHDGRAPHVAGILVRASTISYTLTKPAGDFLTRLSSGAACPVPRGQPVAPYDAQKPVPSAGPYYLASQEGDRTVLLRNPNYDGARPRRPERIVYSDDVETPKAVALDDAGAFDYVPRSDPPLQLDGPLEHAYGAESAAAQAGRQRYYRLPTPWEDGLVLNAARPLFSDIRLRRAVNDALDRRALAKAFADDPNDGLVPPAVVGFEPGRYYPLTPDLPTAQRLAGRRRRDAVLWYCVNGVFGSSKQGQVAQLIRAELAPIGIDVTITRSNCNQKFRYDRTSLGADLIMFSNGSPERDPGAFLAWALDGHSYGAALGRGLWAESSFRRAVARASTLRGDARTRAYVRLVRELMRAAPYAVYGSFVDTGYFAPQVRCKIFQRALGVFDLGALCVPHRD
jgi:ABC-type transport system substrate-binding protein/tRNA A-37 threonylcarbamoyl transferase component Bud32